MNVRTFSFLIASLLLLLCACEKSVNESNLNLAVGERLYSVKDGDIIGFAKKYIDEYYKMKEANTIDNLL